ncbi:hypothetical protein TNIN_58441 [Trichonephila inaurata madagascariensis]|uniref:Uncharacterized protein n=1 Tax=Trichonephila inaurata madagascariensis TaxID=2747483 RepID=A0A8X6WX55_9ARAC|nr:hypothetical protein TNIN_148611 [Trichonephila inaurata madagascariensis]GFY47968.1 hypothetical protein TNIN_58441 [Trichonephila inaurata madagascariensis]
MAEVRLNFEQGKFILSAENIKDVQRQFRKDFHRDASITIARLRDKFEEEETFKNVQKNHSYQLHKRKRPLKGFISIAEFCRSSKMEHLSYFEACPIENFYP